MGVTPYLIAYIPGGLPQEAEEEPRTGRPVMTGDKAAVGEVHESRNRPLGLEEQYVLGRQVVVVAEK